MKFLLSIRKKISESFDNKAALIIYSVLISVLAWFVISITIYPTTPKTISNIALTIDTTGTSAEENNLSVISRSVKNVTVTIQGKRSRIGSLSADDLEAKAIVENVTSAGEKDLKIEVTSKDSNVKFDVTAIKPATVSVMFDRIDTREFELTVDAPNITAKKDLYMDSSDFSCDPGVIEIEGPSSQLDSIDKAVVQVDNEKVLDSAYTFHSDKIVLYDKNQSKIDMSNMKTNTSDFTIKIPVYMQKTLDLTYDLKYAPQNFDVNSIDLELSVDSITLASPNLDLKKLDSWHLDSIPLYELDMDYTGYFNIEIPENYKDLSNIKTVTAKLNTEGLSTKEVTVNDISIVNPPSGYDCKVKTYGLTFAIIGPEEDIKDITEKDIMVYVDLLKYDVQSENFSADATISFPNYNKVWAVGLQKVAINATKQETSD